MREGGDKFDSERFEVTKAGMDRKTARKYLNKSKPPDERQAKHRWRTRQDPLIDVWPEAQGMLEDAPELSAKELFEFLLERYEDLPPNHLRTFQRRVRHWRVLNGPEKEVFFEQDYPPGKFMQLDWTHCRELGITIQGVKLDHLLCHCVLIYSNWEWASRCQSESMLSLRHGLQEGLHQLGSVPDILQLDNSSAATHHIGPNGQREFNKDFLWILHHYRIKARTIQIGKAHQNGDVESLNGHLKRRLTQHLLLRGSRNFDSLEEYDQFVVSVLRKANAKRIQKLNEEINLMSPLPPTRLSEYDELTCTVGEGSTIRVKKVVYSVPSRLISHTVKVEVYEDHLKIFHERELLLEVERRCGDRRSVINWRHLIEPLLRKPGAFARYRYRQEFFPSGRLRAAYDQLVEDHGARRGDLEYLRLLKFAVEVGVDQVERYLEYYAIPLRRPWLVATMRQDLERVPVQHPTLSELNPQLSSYDALLDGQEEERDVC